MTPQAVQTREETILLHRERLNAVLLHIQENLDASLTVEALAAGYETPAAFGRAFKKRFQASPRTFRLQRRPTLFANNWEPLHLQPEFRQRPDHELVYIPCVGAEADSEAVWTMLQQHPGLSGRVGVSIFDSQEAPTYVQICRERPNEGITARDKMRVDAGILLDESASIQPC